MIGSLVNMEEIVQCYLHLVRCLPDPDNYMMRAAALVIKLLSESSQILLSEYVTITVLHFLLSLIYSVIVKGVYFYYLHSHIAMTSFINPFKSVLIETLKDEVYMSPYMYIYNIILFSSLVLHQMYCETVPLEYCYFHLLH